LVSGGSRPWWDAPVKDEVRGRENTRQKKYSTGQRVYLQSVLVRLRDENSEKRKDVKNVCTETAKITPSFLLPFVHTD